MVPLILLAAFFPTLFCIFIAVIFFAAYPKALVYVILTGLSFVISAVTSYIIYAPTKDFDSMFAWILVGTVFPPFIVACLISAYSDEAVKARARQREEIRQRDRLAGKKFGDWKWFGEYGLEPDTFILDSMAAKPVKMEEDKPARIGERLDRIQKDKGEVVKYADCYKEDWENLLGYLDHPSVSKDIEDDIQILAILGDPIAFAYKPLTNEAVYRMRESILVGTREEFDRAANDLT